MAILASPLPGDLNMGTGHEGPGASEARAVPGLRHVQSGAAKNGATNTHGCEHIPHIQHCAHPCARGTHEQTLSSLSLLVPSDPGHQGEGLAGGSPEAGRLRWCVRLFVPILTADYQSGEQQQTFISASPGC